MPETFSLNHHISDVMQDYIKELDFKCQHPNELRGISTGYERLDERMGGLKEGEVTLIGARPAMGKTAFAINLAYHMAVSFEMRYKQNEADDKCVVYVALELPPKLFAQIIFHPKQKLIDNKDGTLTVKFKAGGKLEMDWFLYTWGDKVKVLKPKDWYNKA